MRRNTVRDGHPLEVSVGMEFYSTDFKGVEGKLKTRFEDFVVEEITPEKEVLAIQGWLSSQEELHIKGARDRYISFTLQKMGLSTIDVSTIIASALKIPVHHVSYAGLKDKRALTVQAMSVPARSYDSLKSLNLSNISLRNLRYRHHPIQIGDLWGNRFKILLRDLEADCEEARELTQPLKTIPLLNYFGIQRFGLTRPNTHLVGSALVKRDFEKAIRHLLTTTSEYESQDLTEARLDLEEDMIPTKEIIDLFPRDLRYEKLVMKHLIKNQNDYRGAVSKIPPRVLTIFVHSYQSYLFNRLISLRIKNHMNIRIPEPGDFIVKLDVTHSGRDLWLYVTEANIDERSELVKNGEYGLAAPIPGYSTKVPNSKQSELLLKILQDDDVSLLDFRNPENRFLDSPGGLHLVSIKLHHSEITCLPEGLQFSFSLRKGSYATIVMREVMKNHPVNRV
jgi:tRNA pseudouridine13 synthase